MATFDLTPMQLHRALEAACAAPSVHNTQPWAFRVEPDRVELYLDQARTLPIGDRWGRESRIGCGAALLNLRLALGQYGVRTAVSLLPRGDDGPLAAITRTGSTIPAPETAELRSAIPHRRTNRRPFFPAEVPREHHQILARSAAAEGGVLHIVTEAAALNRIRDLAATAHRLQSADPAWVAEWDRWTRREGTVDGVPMFAAGPRDSAIEAWVLRDFGKPDRREPAGDDETFERKPLIAVLATTSDFTLDHVRAGQAMERTLLAATVLGMSASFVSQLIEVESVSRQLRVILGGSTLPQVVMRIGYGNPTPATPRRPVEDCLIDNPTPTINRREKDQRTSDRR